MRWRMWILSVAVPAAVFAALMPRPVSCQEVSAQLSSVQEKVSKGQVLEAFEELKEVELAVWRAMPSMAARRVVLVEKEPPFFGSYVPKPGGSYRAGELIYLYVEPAGYTIREADGIYNISLTADYTLVGTEGKIIGGQRDFGRWKRNSRRPLTEFPMSFIFDFSGLSPGTYTIETIIKDTLSEKTLELSTPVVIVE